MRRDLFNDNSYAQAFAPGAHTSSVAAAGVDLQGFEGATVVVDFGAWTDGSHTPKLQESPDNSTWTDVDASDLLGAFTPVSSSAGENATQKVGYIGSQRYIAVPVTVSGATTGAVYGVVIHRGYPWDAPVA